MGQIIGILSGKGGVGKTTLVANLGAALTDEFDKNVVILDTNLNTSHLGLHLGMYEDMPVTLREVVKKNMPVSYAIYVHPSTGIRVIPASLSGDGVNLTISKLKAITKKLLQSYELVIMDCPPGLGKEAVTSISALDSALIVTTPDFPAVADALKTVNLLEKMNKKIIGIVLNKVRGEKYELTVKEVESTCGVKVVAVVPDDKEVPEAIADGIPATLLFPYGRASTIFKTLAGDLVGAEYKPGGIFDRIKSMFSRPKQKEAVQEAPKAITTDGTLGKQEMIKNIKKSEKKDLDEITDQLRGEIRDELKKEIMEKVKKRMSE